MFLTAIRKQDESFTDRSEVLRSPSEHHVFCQEDSVMVTQDAHGQMCIVIGSQATDEQMIKLAKRVNTDLAALMAFRDTKRESPVGHSKSGA
ncbi:hypothetical protein [Fluviibacter phosphoraccumulans]|uniref:Uncharacterized protein n=1 Tax=Fluviibacter phosphoraccumulans TaxID=1751046 RepID=A0A679I9F1_9RHOO|nr:hypothetical protein [Fluviibacter phosphoraccumulans]BBU69277.1 hypothetical protein ICHIAU1_15600 [Fluviibacter phosphoraccumulans]BBU71566.1 hypothetical protein ICHIJ1_14850 [Fluviibacter phosphoraccumulans]BCA65212.1 hypothetical protein SHINM1_008140 [Fluviibacter phosphoraccumulans]